MNPLVMSNLATLTATMALRSAVAQLEELAQAMDVKLDRLLEDNRAKALGDVQGLTHVLLRAFELYEETGKIPTQPGPRSQVMPRPLHRQVHTR